MTENFMAIFFTIQHSDLNNYGSSIHIVKLINLVKKYQFLYGKSHKYCNNIITENAWTETNNSLDNTTGNYTILYSENYILRYFCNVLRYEIHTIMKFHNHVDNFNN